jgi:hypothetical protein
VKLTCVGDVGECVSAWMYAYGSGGYTNDKATEPMSGETLHVKKDEWMTVRLDLDGPYGSHSTSNHPNVTPVGMMVWGIHLNTWGCP